MSIQSFIFKCLLTTGGSRRRYGSKGDSVEADGFDSRSSQVKKKNKEEKICEKEWCQEQSQQQK
nr:MAG TPA: hypothetical protein [Caudoviricetes sp.]